jgi:hypothetical protein
VNRVDRTGCREHTDAGCYALRLSDLQSVLLRTDYTISKYGANVEQKAKWGYPCNDLTEVEYYKLQSYRDVIKDYYDAIRLGYNPCLSYKEIQRVIEFAKKLNDFVGCSVELADQWVDKSSFDYNQSCVPYELWEKAMFIRMPKLAPKVTLKQCLRFAFDLSVTLDRKIVYQLLYDISVEQRPACDIQYKVKVDTERCHIEYDKIVKANKCDLEYTTYVALRECGLSYDLISELTECGVDVRYDKNNNEIYFETLQGNNYNLADLHSLDKIKI